MLRSIQRQQTLRSASHHLLLLAAAPTPTPSTAPIRSASSHLRCLLSAQQPYTQTNTRRITYSHTQQAEAATAAASSPSSSPSADSSPAASASASASSSSAASEVVWLYRIILRHIRSLPDASQRAPGLADARRQFREKQCLSDDALIRKALTTAYSKLSFLRMATPKHHQPKLASIPPYPQAKALFRDVPVRGEEGREGAEVDSSVSAGISSFVYVGGEIVPAHERVSTTSRVVNSQGITDEQVRRHQALVDRMQFRGPHWANKPKY